jgi:hypothetical protein
MTHADYLTLLALLSPVLLVALAVRIYEQKRLHSSAKANTGGIDAVYQDHLATSGLAQDIPTNFDFVFSAKSSEAAEFLAARLRTAGYAVSLEPLSLPDEAHAVVLTANRVLAPREVIFTTQREDFSLLTNSPESGYVGPGPKTLEALGLSSAAWNAA